MKLTKEELNDFPLQPGISCGSYFEIRLTDDGRRLIIQIDSIDDQPFEYLRYGGHVYRLERISACFADTGHIGDWACVQLLYKAT